MTRPQAKNQPKRNPSIQNERENLYQCEHCMDFFKPKKRFVQKYCSESCRVMAYRDRNTTVEGISIRTGNNKPGRQKPDHQPRKNPHTSAISEAIREVKAYMDEREEKLIKKITAIHTNQQYHMLISAIAPFFAEPIRQKLINLRNGNLQPQDLNQLIQQIEPLMKNLPPDLKTQLIQATAEYWKKGEQKSSGALPAL